MAGTKKNKSHKKHAHAQSKKKNRSGKPSSHPYQRDDINMKSTDTTDTISSTSTTSTASTSATSASSSSMDDFAFDTSAFQQHMATANTTPVKITPLPETLMTDAADGKVEEKKNQKSETITITGAPRHPNQRHKLEYKMLRKRIEKMRIERSKLRKSKLDEKADRKALSREIKVLEDEYKQRVDKELKQYKEAKAAFDDANKDNPAATSTADDEIADAADVTESMEA